jgi:parvulin-like peptidyl-prolyl isomerase
MKEKMMMTRIIATVLLCWTLYGVNAVAIVAAQDMPHNDAATHEALLAKMAEFNITQEEYDAAVAAAARGKFYHGKTPEGELRKLQIEVADRLITNALLLREANRRGLKPDADEVRKTLESYEQLYADSEQWKNNRTRLLPELTERLERASLLKQLELAVRAVPEPDEKQVREYYLAYPEKFTEPEQLRVALILLKVEPSAPETTWKKAEQEAAGMVQGLRAGGDFASLARLHSADPSAAQGGDLGYVHRGMLPDAAQALLESAKPGEVAAPLRLLEGVAVLQLLDRKPARLNSLETVRDRARDLLKRDKEDAAWAALISKLKK